MLADYYLSKGSTQVLPFFVYSRGGPDIAWMSG